jgi:hypothetical protein
VALFALVLAVDHLLTEQAGLRSFAAYAVLTGLGSMALAFANRGATRLGPWAWTIMLAWAGHLWAIVWLVNIDVLDLPRASLSAAVVIAFGAAFLAAETLAVDALRRRLHRET